MALDAEGNYDDNGESYEERSIRILREDLIMVHAGCRKLEDRLNTLIDRCASAGINVDYLDG